MSHSTYGRMWAEAQGALNRILEEELPEVPPQPQKDRLLAFQSLATFYVKYLQILRSLEAIYDQMVHPQKRRVVRQVLDGVTGRLLELKNEMVELEFSEFHYYDDLLQDLKLTPEDLEIPIPRYFLSEKLRVLQEREKLLASILARGDCLEPKADVQVWSLAMEEAVRLLQVAERARQGRLRASFMKEIRREEERYLHGRNRNDSAVDHDAAATLIQKVWRGFSTRKRMRKERLEEMVFLGMMPPPQQGRWSVAQARLQQVEGSRRLLQEKHEEDFLQAQDGVRDSVRDIDGPDLQQTMQDQIRQWFIECRDATGKFPDYPSVDEGGSLAIFAQKTPEQLAADLAAKEEEKEKRKKDKAKKEKEKSSGKEGKEKKGKGKKKGKKGGGDPEEEEKGWIMPPSSFLPAVMEGSKTYEEVWQNRDETQNLAQTFDVQLVREEKRAEVEAEVRVQVDELMRQELKNLKMVVDRVKEKKKKGKKNSKKKKGKGSKKKKRREKDLTADRTIESLYEELVLGRFLIKPQSVKLSDYIGEYSYLGSTLRQTDIEPMPSPSDVRQLVALYGILPLGSQVVHERAPPVKALLLAGPAGVGKRMLVHAVCAETGANLFNLSPANLAGRYPGRSGLQFLLHVVFKVARALQPSVIWIGDAEKTFYKKVPKSEKEFEPKRLKKVLPKLLKQLRPEDRVLIVGTTGRPFDADLKPFCKVYRKIILIPRPDYGTRLAIWRHSLLELGVHLTPDLDLSSLAKVTDGYTQGSILQAAQAVLTQRRLDIQTQRPLRALEFISPLARQDPVYKEEEETFKAWYSRTPLGKKRARASKASQEGGETGDGAEKAGKGKKKGKEAKGKGQKKKKKKK